jgi:3-hydroxyisobutyrate dehydrogenase-like beta-hydroxyacid dehydrogenase
MNVAVIGLGVMGHGMAGQILAHGHELTVYNRTAGRAADLRERGALVAATPREAAQAADAVLIMVSNDQALHDVASGPDGFLSSLGAGALVLQMSTVGPETTAWLQRETTARGAELVDGPVLGSLPEANAGRLWILAGGDESTIERARPVLESVGQAVYHVGPIGQGTRLKLCSNMITAGLVAALAEGMALLESLNLDPALYIRVIKDADLASRVWGGKATLMMQRDFAPRFSLDNMSKDVSLALQMARDAGFDLPQGAATLATLLRGAEAVGGDRDMAAAVEGVHSRVSGDDAARR